MPGPAVTRAPLPMYPAVLYGLPLPFPALTMRSYTFSYLYIPPANELRSTSAQAGGIVVSLYSAHQRTSFFLSDRQKRRCRGWLRPSGGAEVHLLARSALRSGGRHRNTSICTYPLLLYRRGYAEQGRPKAE